MFNPYKAFRALVPEKPLLVGVVASVSGGVAQVALPGGGIVSARGDATSGQRVFARDGVIEGQAPSLPVVLIDV